MHRPSPPSEDWRYEKPDASVTGSAHANHGSARSPRPTREGPTRDRPIAGPRTGTTQSEPGGPASAGASGRHKEPCSRPASPCPAQLPSKSRCASPRDGERHHGVGKADRSTDSDWTGRGAAHQRGATRHPREARRRPQLRHTDRCQATTSTGSAHNTRPTTQQVLGNTGPTPHKPQPGVAGYKRSTHTSRHTPRHPSQELQGRSQNPSPGTHTHTAHPGQEWRGTGGARTQTHTHTNTLAKSGGAQPKSAPTHTQLHRTARPGVAGCGRSAHKNANKHQHRS